MVIADRKWFVSQWIGVFEIQSGVVYTYHRVVEVFRGEDVIHWDCSLGWTWTETSPQRLTPIELVNAFFDKNVQ